MKQLKSALILFILLGAHLLQGHASAQTTGGVKNDILQDIKILSSFGDRSTGSPGAIKAAAYIKRRFSELGFEEIGTQRFTVPVRRFRTGNLTIPERGVTTPLHPMQLNLIASETTPPEGIEGPLVYVRSGDLRDFNGKEIAGSIVLMDIDSGKNWLYAAEFGAKGLIYLDRGPTSRIFFKDKIEITPIRFPRFHMPINKARELFGDFESLVNGQLSPGIQLRTDVRWEEVTGDNVYCMIPGRDPKHREELVMIEAFYDSTTLVFGQAPGADEACSVAALLETARYLKQNPPEKSVLLVATSGHAQTLAGMRDLMWSLRTRSRDLRKMRKEIRSIIKDTEKRIKALKGFSLEGTRDPAREKMVLEAVTERIKTEVDHISRRLMQLRLEKRDDVKQAVIEEMAGERLLLRRLSWRKDLDRLTPEEVRALNEVIPLATEDHETILRSTQREEKLLNSARAFRSMVNKKELTAALSLHLSSHGDGLGAFNQGWLQWLKPTVKRIAAYSAIDDVLQEGAAEVERAQGLPSLFRDTLRPNKRRSWETYFFDRPPLGGEVSALAGYLGVSLVTVQDARQWWGTPYDEPDRINWESLGNQSRLVCGLVQQLAGTKALQRDEVISVGFSTVTGEAKFLRQGELFADQPAPGSMVLAFQGPSHYYAMANSRGMFRLKGMADKRHVYDKVIIEGYKYDPKTGETIWAIDKKQTGKDAYRLKMYRRAMKTKLIMFACKQTTLFNLLEPRSFRYMTKIDVLDGRREAKPLRYWWSRIDTRESTLATICLDQGTPLKFLLSDTVLRKKLILTNATPQQPQGTGYRIEDWPFIHNTTFRVAYDMWTLLGPRIANLEEHGIFNDRISELQEEGLSALKSAEGALKSNTYDQFVESTSRSWALAARVYDDVEKTQKDVLFGVLFYIALFVPFAFCMERFIFAYSNINKRIIAFSGILLLLIALIYKVHPAFDLAYSPMVVILAFFIIGLSFIVTMIIFFRFEQEMEELQSRAKHMKVGEVNRWKAFAAAFFLGVTNLRRRRLRTILTCITLIILTFTIMSFTSVKSTRHHARILYKDKAPYQGFLLKNFNWLTMPRESLSVLLTTFEKKGVLAPRVWLESFDKTESIRVPVRFNGTSSEAQALVGLSPEEGLVSGLDRILVGGRWFEKGEKQSILLPERMSERLGINPEKPEDSSVLLWGVPFKVVGVFSGKKLQEQIDLDGEPLTPVTFPHEVGIKITEEEMEAMESGDDVRAFQSRYQHVPGDLTLIVPYGTLLAAGGSLKSIAVKPGAGESIQTMARDLVDRFGLSLFSGEGEGTFLYHASDTMGYSGVPNILIPLLISIFIVLNTMISSVYERKREIGIYTSVGLAPSHVSFLFIAEALAFAVLSVVLGYLLAQTTASIFSGTSLWAGITVNYSSLAGVAAMVLVILVVFVSVIYPSRVASSIAIPDVTRSWKLPDSVGNTLELVLPTQLKYKEYRGVGGYVYDYLKAHHNVSHGIFSTGDLSFGYMCPVLTGINERSSECSDDTCCTGTCMDFHAKVWLAPFDFGITQRVDVQFCPVPEDPEFLGIKVRLVREAGEANAWRRINKAFLNDLRKQLLMWRSLDEVAQKDYEKALEGADTAKEGDPDS